MIVTMKFKFFFISAIITFLISVMAFAATKTWTGSVNSDWNNALNWSESVPASGDIVVIPGSLPNYPNIKAGQLIYLQQLTINAGGTITMSGGSLSVASGAIISGTFTQSGGFLSPYILALSNNAIFNQTGGELQIRGDIKVPTGTSFLSTDGTVLFSGGSGGSDVYSGNIQLYHVIIDSLGYCILKNNSDHIKIAGDFINKNPLNNNTKGTFTFNGSDDQYINSIYFTGNTTFANLEINNPSGVVYLGSNIEVNGNVTVTNGILDIETFDLQSSSAAGMLTLDNNSELRIGASYPTNFVTENFSDESVINYNGTTNQTVRYGFVRRGLKLEGGGTKTADGDITVIGDVFIAPDVTFNTGGNLLTVNGSIYNDGDFVSTNNSGPMSFYSKQSGDLNSVDTWSNTGYLGAAATRLPGAVNNDILIIGNGKTVTLASDANNFGTVRVESNGKLILGNYFIGGSGVFDLRSGGSLVVSSPNGVTATGNDGSIQTAIRKFGVSAHYEYNGISPQVTGDGLSESVSDLTINNSAGVTLSRSINISGNLNLTQGSLALGDKNLTLSTTSSITGNPSSSKMIITNGSGQLRKEFLGVGSFNFPVGDNTGAAEYSPVTLNFTSGTFSSGYASVNVVNAKHPHNNSIAHYINRYWTVSSGGITNFSCDVTFNYSDTDIQSGADETKIYAGHYSSPNWTILNQANPSLNELTGTVSSFSDFTGGEIGALTVVDAQVDPTANSFALSQNYPNPFNPSTKISWQSPISSWQTLKVYDVLGNEVATLVNEFREAGFYEVEFSAKGGSASGRDAFTLTSGVYIYKIQVYPTHDGTGDFSETKKMILTK